MPAWVLIPLQFSVPAGTEKLNKSPQVDKKPSPQVENMLHMFNNNTYTDFRTAYKHILIPIRVIQVI